MWGPGDAEDHHGAGLWAWEGDYPDYGRPFLMLNVVGIEWSLQFLADPQKVDLLRQNALRFYAMFPNSVLQLDKMGCDATALLNTQITDAATVADWVDSIMNASVPLPKAAHTGVLPNGAGAHHYPGPIIAGGYIKHDDFEMWVADGSGVPVAVVPVAPRGSGVAQVAVVYAPPQSDLHPAYAAVREQGELLVLPADHPITQAAFAKQK